MKKYTIKDDKGNKKIIYADSLSHALKLNDAFNLKPGDVYLKKNNDTTVYKVLKIDNTDKGFNSINITTEAYTYNVFSGKIKRESGAFNQSLDRNSIETVFFSMNEAIKYLQRKAKQYESFSKRLREDSKYSIQQFKTYIHNIIKDLYGNDYNTETVRAISKLRTYANQVIDDFKADIKNSNLDKRKTVQYYTQYVDALYKEITNVANIQNIDGKSLGQIDDIQNEMARSIHDSKLQDVRLEKGDWFTLRNIDIFRNAAIYKVVDDQQKEINGFSKAMIVEKYRVEYYKTDAPKIVKVGNESFHPERWSEYIVRFNSAKEAIEWLKRQMRLLENRFNSKTRDEASFYDSVHDEDNFFYYDADEDRRSLDDYKRIMQQCGLTITKVKGNSREAYIYYKGSSSAEQKAADKLGISLDDSINDSIKTFKFFINNKAVSEDEYTKSFIKEATYERQSTTAAKRIIKEDKETAKSDGKSTFIFESGRKFSIICDSRVSDEAPGVDKKKFDRLVNYFNIWGKPSRNELQEVIDYYRLNSATAYQLLYYWGYKNEFEKLHFYDSIYDGFSKY